MKYIKEHAYAFYLGGALAAYNIYWYQPSYWIITVPTIVLVAWARSKSK